MVSLILLTMVTKHMRISLLLSNTHLMTKWVVVPFDQLTRRYKTKVSIIWFTAWTQRRSVLTKSFSVSCARWSSPSFVISETMSESTKRICHSNVHSVTKRSHRLATEIATRASACVWGAITISKARQRRQMMPMVAKCAIVLSKLKEWQAWTQTRTERRVKIKYI